MLCFEKQGTFWLDISNKTYYLYLCMLNVLVDVKLQLPDVSLCWNILCKSKPFIFISNCHELPAAPLWHAGHGDS